MLEARRRTTMKRALSVATVTALSLLFCLFVGYAQEEGALAVPELLEQELAAMETAFGGLEAFMADLVGEVKGNMGDIDTFNGKLEDYRDIVEAVSVEIKTAEGKIVGLRADVDALGATQQELKVRVVALEAGLSELAAFCDELKARIDVNTADLQAVDEAVGWLASDYGDFKVAYEAFKSSITADLLSLADDTKAGLLDLERTFTADMTFLSGRLDDVAARVLALEEEDVGTFKKKVLELERSMAALSIRVDNNRAKLEGFDYAIASLSEDMTTMQEGILESNQALLSEYDARLLALEEGNDVQSQIDTLFFISIVALLAGVGALIWGFLGNS
jgi:chromosome segregation ATPase